MLLNYLKMLHVSVLKYEVLSLGIAVSVFYLSGGMFLKYRLYLLAIHVGLFLENLFFKETLIMKCHVTVLRHFGFNQSLQYFNHVY